tara:strand:- start:6458 stop:7354 length:897 start_codon:yes stop_codon:yes gene_type:complete
MNSLVTGGCGFIGSHIVNRLVSLGHNVRVLDDKSAESNEKFPVNSRAQYHYASIRNYDEIVDLFANVDNVFHLAAESRIGPCIDHPQNACLTNVLGTCNVLQASREKGVKKFIYSGTSSAYGLANKPPLKEDMPRDCLNPYAVTKTAGEDLAKMYYTLWGLKTVSFRYFNVYGEGQPHTGQYAPVIGIFLRQLKEKGSLTIVGDGLQSRDFVYINDVVDANMLAMETDKEEAFGEVFNIGSGSNISILDIANLISDNHEFQPSRLGEAQHTIADITKAKEVLGFNPKGNVSNWIKKQL